MILHRKHQHKARHRAQRHNIVCYDGKSCGSEPDRKRFVGPYSPTVALMSGEESPMFCRHSFLMKSDTPFGKFW